MDNSIDQIVRDIVREELADLRLDMSADPDLIKIDEAAKICDVSQSTIEELHRNRQATGFPSVQISPRNIRIDKRRLSAWLASGGLGVKV